MMISPSHLLKFTLRLRFNMGAHSRLNAHPFLHFLLRLLQRRAAAHHLVKRVQILKVRLLSADQTGSGGLERTLSGYRIQVRVHPILITQIGQMIVCL